jgi:hypothetical protein
MSMLSGKQQHLAHPLRSPAQKVINIFRYQREQMQKHQPIVDQLRYEFENVTRLSTSVTLNDLITKVLQDQSSDPLVHKPKDGNPFDKKPISKIMCGLV